MGQIIVETPLNITINYVIQDTDAAKSLIENLDDIALRLKKNPNKPKTPDIEMPSVSRKEALDEAFGMWADRKETGEEISMRIRKANRRQK
jgi:hypothetical protein